MGLPNFSVFTTVRQNVQAAAQAVTPFSGTLSQVVLGTVEFAAGTNFFGNILTTGPWLFIEPSAGEGSGYDFNGDFTVEANFVYGFAKDAAYDFTAADDIIGRLAQIWSSFEEFVLGGSQGVFKISWGRPAIRVDLGPNIAVTKFTLAFKLVLDQIIGTLLIVKTHGIGVKSGTQYIVTGAA